MFFNAFLDGDFNSLFMSEHSRLFYFLNGAQGGARLCLGAFYFTLVIFLLRNQQSLLQVYVIETL